MRNSAVGLVVIVLIACVEDKQSAIDYIHSNGLTLKLPADLVVHNLGEGFAVQIAASLQERIPKQVLITKRQSESPPAGRWSEKKSATGRLFFFRLDREEGGSGGVRHTLTAWCPYADGYVWIVQAVQAEWPAPPDHALAWMVMDAIRQPHVRGLP
jgi:hypothetical protein